MLKKLNNQKVAIFIDGKNCEIRAREMDRFIYYRYLLGRINDREITRALHYNSEQTTSAGLKHVLKNLGIETKTSPKNADVWLAVDAITIAEKADVIVIAGGDIDFVPLSLVSPLQRGACGDLVLGALYLQGTDKCC